MSNIAFQKYVDITSAVGGAPVAVARELILRLFTTDPAVSTNSVVEFTDAEEVRKFFDRDATKPEFLQAQFYFSFVSKLSTSPTKISFARWADVDTAPTAFGGRLEFEDDFSVWQAITTGSITVTFGGDTEELLGLNFSSISGTDDIAAVVQAGIQSALGTSMWTAGTCIFEPGELARFTIQGGDAGAAVIGVDDAATGTPILALLGMAAGVVRLSDGVDAQSITEVLTESTALNNNFGSFAFIGDPVLTVDNAGQVVQAATWNHGENIKYMYLQRVLEADAASLVGFIAGLSGTGLTIYDAAVTAEYPWLIPGMIMAATPYQQRASVQNYMFQQVAGVSSTVGDTTLSNTLDALNVNYYGNTQQAGQIIAFYQRGLMQGLSDAPSDMGVFSNEVFLKDGIGVDIINLLLALSAISANATGIGKVLATIQASIDLAVFNGSISIGKTLNVTQRAFVTSVTGDANAFLQIQNIGYWVNAVIGGTDPNFEIQYTLLYSKNDVVRKVVGAHTLI